MKLNEHKDLKKEILALPVKEKDKILLRLVAKDKVLTEHLHFLLLEDESNLRDRIAVIRENIVENLAHLEQNTKNTAKETLSTLRKLTKDINHFYKVTKADFDEVELKILMFTNAPLKFKYKAYAATKSYEDLYDTYVIKSILVLLRKFAKLHEDLQFDLKDQMNKMLAKVYASSVATTAKELGLPNQI